MGLGKPCERFEIQSKGFQVKLVNPWLYEPEAHGFPVRSTEPNPKNEAKQRNLFSLAASLPFEDRALAKMFALLGGDNQFLREVWITEICGHLNC